MSIKSLFENIADAIREKSGSSDTYTPAEMPQAILDIQSENSQSFYMIDENKSYIYALNKLIYEGVGSSMCGNEFTVNLPVKMIGVKIYSRVNTNASIKLTDVSGNILYLKSVSTVANMWQDFDIDYNLLPNTNYIIFVDGVREMFTYAYYNPNIGPLLQDYFTFIQGHYAGIPGSPAPSWIFSVIPKIEVI